MKIKAILTSALGGQIKVDGKRIPIAFSDDNGFLTLLRSVWKAGSKVMFISGSPDHYDRNDEILNCLKESFRLSRLETSDFIMCDERNTEAAELIPEMDVIILAGGHVPTQNAFMKKLKLKEHLEAFNGLVLAWSAGSMNCAETVYAAPELPEEALDPDYQRWISGLGLTSINILPHFQAIKDDILDGMRLIEDITYPDSFRHEIIALNNGSYIVIDDTSETLYGEAYSIKDGVQKQICENGKSVCVSEITH